MPFNKELENFAEAFSAGYGMTKSKEEREAEQLDLEHKRFLNERDPVVAGQEDTLFGLKVDTLKGGLTDAQAARERAKIDQAHTDAAFALDQQIRQGQISDADAARERLKIDQAHADELYSLNVRKGTAEVNQAEYLTSEPVRKRAERVDEANIKQSEAVTGSSLATTARENVVTDQEKLKLEELRRQNAIHQGVLDRIKGNSVPPEFQRHAVTPDDQAVDAGPPFVYRPPAPTGGPVVGGPPADAGGMSIDSAPQGPGPRTSAVEVPPVPAGSPPGSESSMSTFSGEGLEGPPEGSTEGLPVEVPPAEAVDATGVVNAPGQQQAGLEVTDRSKKQQVIDNLLNGGSNELPGGKKGMVVGGHEAVKDGLDLLMQYHGLHEDFAVGTPETDGQAMGFLTGAHAADPGTVKMVEDTVEEQAGEDLSQNQKTFYTLSAGWQYFNGIGDPKSAQEYAANMLAHYQYAFSQYTAVMQAAASSGDIDGAMEAAVRAYANVPTGDELKLSWTKDKKHIKATITDTNGKVTEQQLMTPEEMGAFAMSVNPSSFVSFISQAAGREDKTISDVDAIVLGKEFNLPPEVVSEMTMGGLIQLKDIREKNLSREDKSKHSLADREAAVVAIDRASTAFKEAHPDQAKALNFDDPAKSALEDIRPIAERVVLDSGLTSDRAFRAVVNLVVDGPSRPVKENEDGTVTVHMSGIDPFDMSVDDYMVLTANRRKYGVPTSSGLPADQERYRVGAPGVGGGAVREPAVPVAAPPGSGATTRFSRVPVRPPSYGPPPPVRPGTNPPQSGARTRF